MNVSSSWGTRLLGCVWALFAMAILAGCSGGTDGTPGPAGATGPAGSTGSTGPSGPVLALDISTATKITAKITGVTAGPSPVVSLSLVDQSGNPIKGLLASQVSFAIAQLQVAADGSTQWRSYITGLKNASPALHWTVGANSGTSWGTAPAVQPSTQSGAVGHFTDNGDGTYTFSFSTDLNSLATTASTNYGTANLLNALPSFGYDGTLTHRIGLEIRGTVPTPTNNAVYDYVPGTGSTTNLPATRLISDNTECDACHAQLAMHGGPRIDVKYCVLCHNPGNADPYSGNLLNLRVLAHKVHSGAKLPTVVADTVNHGMVPTKGIGYLIFGYGGSISNFNNVVWPQDTRNCTTCHNTNDPNTPDAINYTTRASAEACGACHDNINFAATTVVKHTGVTGPIADSTCMNSGCHSATSPGVAAIGGGKVDIVTAHGITVQSQMANYKVNIVRVEAVTPNATAGQPDVVETNCANKIAAAATGATVICTVPPGYWPRVTINVVNPKNGNAAYDLTQPPFSTYGTTMSARAAWTTLNYTNPGAVVGSGNPQAQSVSFFAKNGTATNWPAPATTATNTSSSVIPSVPAVFLSNNNTWATARFPYPVPLPSDRVLAGGSGGISVQTQLNIPGVADVGVAVPQVSGSSPAVYATAVPIRAADPAFFPITDTTAVARRQVVDYNNCLRCHKKLVEHGSRTDNVNLCIMCHNPAQAPRESSGAAGSEPVDFKFFIHGIHSANYKAGVLDETGVLFPGVLNNCLACHKTDTYYPVDPAAVFGTTMDPGQAYSTTRYQGYDDPTKHYAITANAAACGACHVDVTAQTHMKQQGAVIVSDLINTGGTGMFGMGYGVPNTFVTGAPHIKAIDGSTLPQYRTETCSVCHGPGATADVKVVHDTTSFKYNTPNPYNLP